MLKLVDYLLVQADKLWYNIYLYYCSNYAHAHICVPSAAKLTLRKSNCSRESIELRLLRC